MFPGQQEGGAGLGGAEAAGDSQCSSPVSSGTSTLSAALTCCLPYRDQHYQRHVNTRDTLAQLEIAELVHFPQSRD